MATPATSDKPRTKRGAYARRARTRRSAIDVAIELFSARGFRGTTLTDVAEGLGMTLSGLQYHFPNIESLLTAVLEEYDQPPADGRRPVQLQDLLMAAEANVHRPRFARLFTVLAAEAIAPEHPAHAYFVNRYRAQREAAAKFFKKLADEGALPPEADFHNLASQLIAAADGIQLQWLLDPDSIDMVSELRRYLRAAIPALANDGWTDKKST